jgi:hypothetical protein
MKKSQITILFISIFALVFSGCSVSESPVDTVPGTPTVVSTMDADEAKEFLFSMQEDNGGCRFPCILGIVPGETTRAEVLESTMKFGKYSIEEFYVDHLDFLADVKQRCEGDEQCIQERLENQGDYVSLGWEEHYELEQNTWNEYYFLRARFNPTFRT